MPTLSVSVPEKLKKKMGDLDEINWSAVARNAFEEKVRQIEFLRKIGKKSKLTEEDAKKISDTISRGMAKQFRSM